MKIRRKKCKYDVWLRRMLYKDGRIYNNNFYKVYKSYFITVHRSSKSWQFFIFYTKTFTLFLDQTNWNPLFILQYISWYNLKEKKNDFAASFFPHLKRSPATSYYVYLYKQTKCVILKTYLFKHSNSCTRTI